MFAPMLESFDDSVLSDDVVVLLAHLAVELVLVESVAQLVVVDLVLVESVAQLVVVDVVVADSAEPVLSSDCT